MEVFSVRVKHRSTFLDGRVLETTRNISKTAFFDIVYEVHFVYVFSRHFLTHTYTNTNKHTNTDTHCQSESRQLRFQNVRTSCDPRSVLKFTYICRSHQYNRQHVPNHVNLFVFFRIHFIPIFT